jgi:hypothetical protein
LTKYAFKDKHNFEKDQIIYATKCDWNKFDDTLGFSYSPYTLNIFGKNMLYIHLISIPKGEQNPDMSTKT